jgi:hypothetical protein
LSGPTHTNSTKARELKAERRARAELEAHERQLAFEREYEGSKIAAAIGLLERRARRLLNEKLPPGVGAAAWPRLYAQPSGRSIRGLNGQKALEATSRPHGADGAQSFHFKIQTLSRGDELKAALKSPSAVKRFRAALGNHQRYIEREGAAERVLIPDAVGQQDYIDNIEKTERVTDQTDNAPTVEVSSFGNIPGASADRGQFWKLVEQFERVPNHTVVFNPAVDPAVFERARTISKRWVDIPDKVQKALAADEPSNIQVSTETGLDLIKLFVEAGQHDGYASEDDEDADAKPDPGKAVKIKLGRGGVVQIRLVMELPAELTPRQRLDLSQEFCRPYEDKNLRYWAVVHAPTEGNDSRNYHLHINLHDRPCSQLTLPDGNQVWDFAYEKDIYDPKQRRTRRQRPHLQNKEYEIADRSWPKRERERFKSLANEALKRAGSTKRLDARSHAAMCIDQPAKVRIASSDYARERRGQMTAAGNVLAAQEWRHHLTGLVKMDRLSRAFAQGEIGRLIEKTSPMRVLRCLASDARAKLATLDTAENDAQDRRTAHCAATYMAERLSSRARLKAEAERDAVDRAALELAEALRIEADEHHRAVMRHEWELVELESEVDLVLNVIGNEAVLEAEVSATILASRTAPKTPPVVNLAETANKKTATTPLIDLKVDVSAGQRSVDPAKIASRAPEKTTTGRTQPTLSAPTVVPTTPKDNVAGDFITQPSQQTNHRRNVSTVPFIQRRIIVQQRLQKVRNPEGPGR